MKQYNLFLFSFLFSSISLFVAMGIHFYRFIGIMNHWTIAHDGSFFHDIFTPFTFTCFIIGIVFSIIYRILGIIKVIQTKSIEDAERAFWIVGFIFMGFVTAVVFLIIGKKYYLQPAGTKLVDQ